MAARVQLMQGQWSRAAKDIIKKHKRGCQQRLKASSSAEKVGTAVIGSYACSCGVESKEHRATASQSGCRRKDPQ